MDMKRNKCLIIVFVTCCFASVAGQPTVEKQYFQESCDRDRSNLQEALDHIIVALQKLSNENRSLRNEVTALRSRSDDQFTLLAKLSENVSALNVSLHNDDCGCSKTKCIVEKMVTVPMTITVDDTNGQNKSAPRVTDTEFVSDEEVVDNRKDFTYPKDCAGVYESGTRINGTYSIKPDFSKEAFLVPCEIHANEVWTIIQRRIDGTTDFYRNWTDYKIGFGNIERELWLGNEKIYHLTNQAQYKLRIDMWDWRKDTDKIGNYYFSETDYFYIDNENHSYKLHVPQDYFAYRGFGGSGLRVHAGPFMTFDRSGSKTRNCARKYHSGFWFKTCVRNANLNGQYYDNSFENITTRLRPEDDIYWPNVGQPLQRVVMKIQRISRPEKHMQ